MFTRLRSLLRPSHPSATLLHAVLAARPSGMTWALLQKSLASTMRGLADGLTSTADDLSAEAEAEIRYREASRESRRAHKLTRQALTQASDECFYKRILAEEQKRSAQDLNVSSPQTE